MSSKGTASILPPVGGDILAADTKDWLTGYAAAIFTKVWMRQASDFIIQLDHYDLSHGTTSTTASWIRNNIAVERSLWHV